MSEKLTSEHPIRAENDFPHFFPPFCVKAHIARSKLFVICLWYRVSGIGERWLIVLWPEVAELIHEFPCWMGHASKAAICIEERPVLIIADKRISTLLKNARDYFRVWRTRTQHNVSFCTRRNLMSVLTPILSCQQIRRAVERENLFSFFIMFRYLCVSLTNIRLDDKRLWFKIYSKYLETNIHGANGSGIYCWWNDGKRVCLCHL